MSNQISSDLQHLARAAGSTVGKTSILISELIVKAADAGINSYNDTTLKEARKVFADACETNGTTRNSASTMFAAQWDKLASQHGLQARQRTGMGGKPSKGGNPSSNEATPAPVAAPAPQKSALEMLTKTERRAIEREGALRFLHESGLTVELYIQLRTLLEDEKAFARIETNPATKAAIKRASRAAVLASSTLQTALKKAGFTIPEVAKPATPASVDA
jgi:hypothetical protein